MPPDQRVVIVAPSVYDTGIPAPSLPGQITEVSESLQSFFQPVPLIGRVTKQKLFDILRRGATGFWFIGHGQSGVDGGLILSDGIVLVRDVGRYLARADVKWSYLNTCDSGALVEQLQATHPHDVYANITPQIEDGEATQNGVLMAQGIADTGDILVAYRWVTSGGPSKLRLFPSPATEGTQESEAVAPERYIPIDERIRERVAEHDIKLAKLENDIVANRAITIDYIRELRADLVGIKAEIKPLAQADLIRQLQPSSDKAITFADKVLGVIAILLIVIAGALGTMLMRYNQPDPQIIYMVATPTPTITVYFPPSDVLR